MPGLHDMAVMRQAVEQRRRHLGIAKHARPLGESQVGRDHHAGVLVELRQQMEQQGPAGLAERQIAQLIENHQIHAHQRQGDPAGLAGRLLLLQRIDQIHRREEAHPLAVLGDPRHPERRRQMRLAGPGAADEHHVVGCLGKGQVGQLPDQLLIDLRLLEVEAGQIAMHRETWRHASGS